jgi:hypothetical protein
MAVITTDIDSIINFAQKGIDASIKQRLIDAMIPRAKDIITDMAELMACDLTAHIHHMRCSDTQQIKVALVVNNKSDDAKIKDALHYAVKEADHWHSEHTGESINTQKWDAIRELLK